MNLKDIFSLILLTRYTISCDGVFRFANYIQDHMVLQRAPKRAVVWSYSDTNSSITLEMNNKIYIHNEWIRFCESIWSITFDPQPDGGPNQINVH
ncbi:unnamed protein product [Adineta steineri]|uniref:Uncharacterized protein n=1 Tax=Adineta steineri TaxID=433720 RepID=A0A816AST1_9BILA|nr:unnamed protein product [Adineta steineri]CAF1365859.1 unnamed protein product [Adineta steineri]CAF1602043.1 unnamed protein product [Adineta steineri]CAF1602146.1 unnamed protein product [Adineta steineri]